jgi:triosephosphate isomerase (TIM)
MDSWIQESEFSKSERMRAKIIAGNWKMNTDLREALELANAIRRGIKTNSHPTVIIAPPFPFIKSVKDVIEGSPVKISAQNCASEEKGAYTGEVSAQMLKSAGAEYVIIGHSERRTYFDENSEDLMKKLKESFKTGLKPIFCIGENLEERESEKHFAVIENQLGNVLKHFKDEEIRDLIIAYEPVWAIGTGKTASNEQIGEMHSFIRSFFERNFGEKSSKRIPILYGGSCNEKNAREIFSCPDVDGGLVGGASLKAESFLQIINSI